MSHRLWTIVVKEILSYLRDPRSRLILVGPPIVQLVVFAFAATLEVRNVDVAVLNDDAGDWSDELIARVAASSFVDELVSVDSHAALAGLIDRREVLLGLAFDAGFSRDVVGARAASVQVLIDGRRANAGQVALGYINEIAATMNVDLAADSGTGDAAPRAAVRHWFNPNLNYRWFIVPSLTGTLAMMISLMITALSIARERELGTFDQLLVSPATPLEIIVGKTLPAMIIGALLGTAMTLIGMFLFRVPFSGSLWLLLPSLVLFIASTVGIGLTVSSLCQTQQQAILGTFTMVVPIILISGFATPVENMPVWLQYLAEASPLKHFLIIVQGSFLKAMPVGEIVANAWPLAAIAAVTLTIATVVVRGRLQ